MNPLLSVIVPCYNTGKYLNKCINSVLEQNYNNIEVIVVDDGSTDDTKDIVKKLINKDNRVKYFYKDNSGVSDTRNYGLNKAQGEYITFVDSDDFVEPQIYDVLLSLLFEYSADISHCSYSRVNEKDKRNIGGTRKIYEMNSKDSIDKLLNGGLFAGGVWNKIYKRSILADVRFDIKYKINEDILFNFYAFLNSKKIVFIDECFYNYNSSDTSSCVVTNQIKKSKDCYDVSKEIYEKCNEIGYDDISYNRVCNSRIGLYRAYIFSGKKKKYKKEYKTLRSMIVDDYNNRRLSGNQKINGMFIKYLPIIYKPFYFIYNKIRKPNWDV